VIRSQGGWPARLLLLASLVALGLGGGIRSGVAWVAAIALFLPTPRVAPAAWFGAHAGILVAVGMIAAGGRGEEGLAVLVGWLAVHRSWTGTSSSDGRIGVLFATLLTLLGAVATESSTLGPVLLAWVILLPMALLHVELGRVGSWRAPVVAAAVSALTLGIYAILPRLQGGYGARAAGTAVPEEVTLGDDATDPGDQAVVARVRVRTREGARVPGPHHVRGRALDRFDGTRWTTSFDPTPAGRVDEGLADRFVDVELQPMAGGVLFGVPEMLGARGVTGGVASDSNGSFFHRQPPVRLRYLAISRVGPLPDALHLSAAQELAYLSLPPVDRRVADLAFSIAPDEDDPRRLAQELADWLDRELAYEANPPAPVGDPLADFLLVRRSGHCEYFASALVVMLRLRGVPARMATGFWSGELDEDGETIVVRRGQAHAWVEVGLASGWTTVDPTPLTGRPTLPPDNLAAWVGRWEDRWNRWVVNYNLDRQIEMLGDAGRRGAELTGQPTPSVPAWAGLRWVAGGVLGVYLVAIVLQLVAGRILLPGRSRGDPLTRIMGEARALVRRRGWPMPAHLPAVEAGQWLVAQVGPPGEPFLHLAWEVYRARYGGDRAGAEARARSWLGELRRLPPAPR